MHVFAVLERLLSALTGLALFVGRPQFSQRQAQSWGRAEADARAADVARLRSVLGRGQ